MPSSEIRYLRREEVMRRTGLRSTSIDRLERLGEFPARHRLSARLCGWKEADILEWLRSRPLAQESPVRSPNPKAGSAAPPSKISKP